MRNGFLFSTARVGALTSIVGAPIVVIADAQRAQAAPQGSRPAVLAARGPDAHQLPFLEFLDEFWQGAWDADFVPHGSGMLLEQPAGDGPRVVLAHDDSGIAGQGRYQEFARFFVPRLGLAPAAAPPGASFSFEHFVTAGVIQGPTGYVKPLYGLAQRVVFAPDGAAPIVIEGLTPLGVTDTPDGAVDAALETLGLLTDDPAPAPGDEPPFEPDLDPCLCDEIYFNDIDACFADAVACEAACAAVAIAGILGCLALGPGAAPCIAAVLAAEVLCLAACLARQKACNLRAKNEWLLCWLDCLP
jgi:hypothetical protein